MQADSLIQYCKNPECGMIKDAQSKNGMCQKCRYCNDTIKTSILQLQKCENFVEFESHTAKCNDVSLHSKRSQRCHDCRTILKKVSALLCDHCGKCVYDFDNVSGVLNNDHTLCRFCDACLDSTKKCELCPNRVANEIYKYCEQCFNKCALDTAKTGSAPDKFVICAVKNCDKTVKIPSNPVGSTDTSNKESNEICNIPNKEISLSLCVDHTCEFSDCYRLKMHCYDKRVMFQKGCHLHNCQTKFCMNFRSVSSVQAESTSYFDFCDEHRCPIKNCNNYRYECKAHLCKSHGIEECKVTTGGGLCKKHKCKKNFCENQVYGARYCSSHKCKSHGCKNPHYNSKTLCKRHVCAMKTCIYGKSWHNIFCIDHSSHSQNITTPKTYPEIFKLRTNDDVDWEVIRDDIFKYYRSDRFARTFVRCTYILMYKLKQQCVPRDIRLKIFYIYLESELTFAKEKSSVCSDDIDKECPPFGWPGNTNCKIHYCSKTDCINLNPCDIHGCQHYELNRQCNNYCRCSRIKYSDTNFCTRHLCPLCKKNKIDQQNPFCSDCQYE